MENTWNFLYNLKTNPNVQNFLTTLIATMSSDRLVYSPTLLPLCAAKSTSSKF